MPLTSPKGRGKCEEEKDLDKTFVPDEDENVKSEDD
jgi:hypothetical protein